MFSIQHCHNIWHNKFPFYMTITNLYSSGIFLFSLSIMSSVQFVVLFPFQFTVQSFHGYSLSTPPPPMTFAQLNKLLLLFCFLLFIQFSTHVFFVDSQILHDLFICYFFYFLLSPLYVCFTFLLFGKVNLT